MTQRIVEAAEIPATYLKCARMEYARWHHAPPDSHGVREVVRTLASTMATVELAVTRALHMNSAVTEHARRGVRLERLSAAEVTWDVAGLGNVPRHALNKSSQQ